MRAMTYSESRTKYAETLNAVVNDREEVAMTRAGHDPVGSAPRRLRSAAGVGVSTERPSKRSTAAQLDRPARRGGGVQGDPIG